jgi:hypothetical protein
MKVTRATAVLIVVLVGAFVFSSVNTYLLFNKSQMLQDQLSQTQNQLNQTQNQLNQTQNQLDQTRSQLDQTQNQLQEQNNTLTNSIDILNETSHLPVEEYDFIIFLKDGFVEAKNGTTGRIDFSSIDAATVMNQAIAAGTNIYVKSGWYSLTSDIVVQNKKFARIDGDDTTIYGNGYKIIIKGDNYTSSQYNEISGLDIINGSLRIENSFGTTINNMVFEKCTTALELANTNTWTEGTLIENSRFKENTVNVVFRTNTTQATGSYTSSEIINCQFNLDDNSVAIKVEPQAGFTDSQLQDVRIWIGGNGNYNQTGLELDGSMYKTQLSGVVFESFAPLPLDNNAMYAISIGPTAYQSPILAGGISFLGNWTARIHNPNSTWIYGFGSAFKQENIPIIIGGNNQYGPVEVINTYPATLTSFRTGIQVQGSFSNNETITVRLQLEFVDNSVSTSIEKTFTNSTTLWLSDDDMLQLFPSQNIVWSILIDAKSSTTTDASVSIDVYGVTT